MSKHTEWERENTLTAPSDRDQKDKFRLDQGAPPLTELEVTEALKALNNKSFIQNFPKVERRYLDPPVDSQKIVLLSFTPAKGATPNEQGFYGFAKVRGSYSTEIEADERAEFLIRTTDSYHQIYHVPVGRPFPLTVLSDFSKEISRVELKRQTADAIGEDVKKKRQDEQREIQEIKDREKNLLEDVKQRPEDNPDDHYTTLRVKMAQLKWTYIETEKKLKQMSGLIAMARRDIEEMDSKDPSYKEKYYNKYMEARKQSGLTATKVETDTSFMKFLLEDVTIPAVDEEYNRLYKKE